MNFVQKLLKASQTNQSLLCVGLDPDPELMPEGISILDFGKSIIEATSDLVCAYKFNLAFFEVLGVEGIEAMRQIVECVPENIPVIGDAKLGDIGNTAKAYAKTIYSTFNFDAATVNPYLGFDSIEPLSSTVKTVFLSCAGPQIRARLIFSRYAVRPRYCFSLRWSDGNARYLR